MNVKAIFHFLAPMADISGGKTPKTFSTVTLQWLKRQQALNRHIWMQNRPLRNWTHNLVLHFGKWLFWLCFFYLHSVHPGVEAEWWSVCRGTRDCGGCLSSGHINNLDPTNSVPWLGYTTELPVPVWPSLLKQHSQSDQAQNTMIPYNFAALCNYLIRPLAIFCFCFF